MLIGFFQEVRRNKVPATIKELLDLINALENHLAFASIDDFYYLSRLCLVKDEKNFDKFDRAFESYFKGIEVMDELLNELIPEDWLKSELQKFLTDEEKEEIESMGGFEELMDALKDRLENQEKKHEGGNRMIGSGGTSPFGQNGYNPEGVRIGQKKGRHGKEDHHIIAELEKKVCATVKDMDR